MTGSWTIVARAFPPLPHIEVESMAKVCTTDSVTLLALQLLHLSKETSHDARHSVRIALLARSQRHASAQCRSVSTSSGLQLYRHGAMLQSCRFIRADRSQSVPSDLREQVECATLERCLFLV